MRTKDQELAYLKYAQSAPKVVAQFPNLFNYDEMDKLRRQDIEIDKMTAELNAREEKQRLQNKRPWYEILSQPKSKNTGKQKGPGRNIAEERMAKQHAKQLQSFDRGNQILKETQKKQQHAKILLEDIRQIQEIADEQTQELQKQQKMHNQQLVRPVLSLQQVPELIQVQNTVRDYHNTTEEVIENRMQSSMIQAHQMQDDLKQQQALAEEEVIRRMCYQRDAAQKTVMEFLDYQQQCEGLFTDGQKLKQQLKKLKTETEIQEQINLQLYKEINFMKAQVEYKQEKGDFQMGQNLHGKIIDRLFNDFERKLQYEAFKIENQYNQYNIKDENQEQDESEEDNNTFITLDISPQPKKSSPSLRPSSGQKFRPKSAYIDKTAINLQDKMDILLKHVNEQLFDTKGDPSQTEQLLKQRNVLKKVQEALKVEAMLLQNNDRYRLRELQVRQQVSNVLPVRAEGEV